MLKQQIDVDGEDREVTAYFRGEKLYGNDFTSEQIERWFLDEENAHFKLGSGNVSAVLQEIGRCLAPGGYFLFREPVYSMGDWRHPRCGLTPHERGIPTDLLRQYVRDAGMEIVCLRRCMVALTWKLQRLLPRPPFNYSWVVALDEAI